MATLERRPAATAASLLCAGALLLGLVPGASGRASRPAGAAGPETTLLGSLLRSRELWATIDVCNPADQHDTVGIRGSMPGDRHTGDTMWMSFRLQYMDAAKQWVDLASTVTKFVSVGHASTVRQAGRSFQLVPKAGRPASTLRGVVDYQWRRGGRVLQSGTRTTTAGHSSRAGADPAGYSAAGCLIG
ncbi:MAG: hypothetical protein ACYDC2_06330 [Solirubrobacteraceae bacterium]